MWNTKELLRDYRYLLEPPCETIIEIKFIVLYEYVMEWEEILPEKTDYSNAMAYVWAEFRLGTQAKGIWKYILELPVQVKKNDSLLKNKKLLLASETYFIECIAKEKNEFRLALYEDILTDIQKLLSYSKKIKSRLVTKKTVENTTTKSQSTPSLLKQRAYSVDKISINDTFSFSGICILSTKNVKVYGKECFKTKRAA